MQEKPVFEILKHEFVPDGKEYGTGYLVMKCKICGMRRLKDVAEKLKDVPCEGPDAFYP